MSRIKFKLKFLKKKIPSHKKIEKLKYWCRQFHKYGLAPYENKISYGNLSFRCGEGKNEFIITASAVGLKDRLKNDCFVKVVRCDLEKFLVHAIGLRPPSSETLLHYAIYRKRGEVNAIFHGHSLPILNAAHSLKLVETKREKPFGSLDLIREVIKVLNDSNFIVMKNHGFLSLGENMDNAGKLAISIQKAAKKILLRNSRDMGATSEER